MADNTGDVLLTVPVPLVDIEDASGSTAVMVMPVPRVAGSGAIGNLGDGALTIRPVMAASGYQSNIGNMLPRKGIMPVLRATGLVGTAGAAVMQVPMPTLAAAGPDVGTLKMPALRLVSSGTTGTNASVIMQVPVPTMQAVGVIPTFGVASMRVPRPAVQAGGTTGTAGAISLTLRGIALAASGATGIVGTAAMTVPMLRLDAEGGTPAIGHAMLHIPTLILQATGYESAGVVGRTLVMQTETSALTEYAEYPFNSYAKFNGVYLGASDDGVFALAGNTDAGEAIDAYARTGISDFNTSHLKRINRVYVGYRTDGDMVLRVITDGWETRDYRMVKMPQGVGGIRGNHINMGRGLDARYWQFEIRNEAGCDFSLDMVEIKPTMLRRRIGGGSA